MLSIMFDVSDERCAQWHVGTACRVHPKLIPHVCEVEADGDELEFIINNSSGLPSLLPGAYPKYYRVQTWYGDHAKWIVGNLLK